uniref:Uncharacterized protein n=1 Tax=Hyaloperonospora arabidopsidis (strain Emoy2) TaxID=559515 RepID=M4C577_HYAAE
MATTTMLQASEMVSEFGFIEPDAAHSNHSLRIPEPMVYDLVRPLGVRQGELEINTLGDYNPFTGDINWAPELEYGLADDLAIEIELPFQNASHERYKFAIQQTLGMDDAQGVANGWQAFVDVNKHTRSLSADATYIHGPEVGGTMVYLEYAGVTYPQPQPERTSRLPAEYTVFYDVSRG